MEEEPRCFFRARGDWDPSSGLAGKTPRFPSEIRLPSTAIRSQYLNQGYYRAVSLIQGSTILLAHSDEPYIYVELWEIHGNPDSPD